MAGKKKEKSGEKIGDALLKVALGYQIAEVTEEYAEVDGALKLTKRKKTKKDIPPDLKAVQMLLAGSGGEEYAKWTDEELEKEKKRLLKALEEGHEETKKTTSSQKDVGMSEFNEEMEQSATLSATVKRTSEEKRTTTRKTATKKKATARKKSAVKK